MTEPVQKPKQTVVFVKCIEVVCRRRMADGKDEAAYVQMNRMNDLRALRGSFVTPADAKEGDFHEVPNYPISDQLFLYLAERQELAQVVDVPIAEVEESSEETEEIEEEIEDAG